MDASAGTSRAPATPKPWRPNAAMRIASLAPHAYPLLVQLLAPTYFGGMFSATPSIAGYPLGTVVTAAAIAWATFGAWLVWTARSRLVATIGLAFFTVPSLLGLILGPAMLLVLQNLP